nr:amidohydrolase family protein [Microbacterium ulmi]
MWEPESPERSWPPGREAPQRAEPFGADEMLGIMDAHGVDRAIIVPPIWIGEDNTDALAWARKLPERFAVMGRMPFASEFAGALATWLDEPGMLGLRLSYPASVYGDWLDHERTRWFWDAAEASRVPLMILCQNQASRIDPIARAHPGLPIILDHVALRNVRVEREAGRNADPAERIADVIALARHPQVFVKFSSLPYYSAEPYPYRDLDGVLERVVDAFGVDRIMWASDLSRMSLMRRPPSYSEILGHVRDGMPFLSPHERAAILGDNALRILGWTV